MRRPRYDHRHLAALLVLAAGGCLAGCGLDTRGIDITPSGGTTGGGGSVGAGSGGRVGTATGGDTGSGGGFLASGGSTGAGSGGSTVATGGDVGMNGTGGVRGSGGDGAGTGGGVVSASGGAPVASGGAGGGVGAGSGGVMGTGGVVGNGGSGGGGGRAGGGGSGQGGFIGGGGAGGGGRGGICTALNCMGCCDGNVCVTNNRTDQRCGTAGAMCAPCAACFRCAADTGICQINPDSQWDLICSSASVTLSKLGGVPWDGPTIGPVIGPPASTAPDPVCSLFQDQNDVADTSIVMDSYAPMWNQSIAPAGNGGNTKLTARNLTAAGGHFSIHVVDDDGPMAPGDPICQVTPTLTAADFTRGTVTFTNVQSCLSLSIQLSCIGP